MHPSADKKVPSLSLTQRELLFYQTRCHDRCYKASGLYQFFFEICPPGQMFSIQLVGEVSSIRPALSRPHHNLTYIFVYMLIASAGPHHRLIAGSATH